MRFEPHPLANLFPLLDGAELAALAADIKANGLHNPIDIYQGKILDGRNRYYAMLAADLEPDKQHVRYFRPELSGDPLKYVISLNLPRRHLNESQRAVVADRLANLAPGRPSKETAQDCAVSQEQAGDMLNVSRRLVQDARAVRERGADDLLRAVERGKLSISAAAMAARLPPDRRREVVERAEAGEERAAVNVIKREGRDIRERELGAKQLALPDKRYGLILGDPEWRFEPYSRETGMDRAADNHYSTTPTDDICARPVADIAAPDCVLALWATAPMLPDALRVMAAWGFAYKTHCIWHKLRPGDGRGSGYWFTGEHELLLIGTRGHVVAPATALCGSVVAAPWQGRHSAKPEAFAELLERIYPTLPKIELNRRGPPRPGWDAWGFEAETSSASLRAPPSKPAPSAPDTPDNSEAA